MATNRQVNQQQQGKASKKNRLKQARLAKRRLTKGDEAKAIYIGRHMFRCVILLKSSLKSFLNSWGLDPRCEDTSEYLKKLMDYNETIPNFISLTPGQITADNTTIKNAISARNAVCHGNLPVLFREWEAFIHALIEVTIMIGDMTLCTEFRRVLNHLTSYFSKQSARVEPYVVPLGDIFKSLESDLNPGKWTKVKKCAAVSIANILFDVLIKELAPACRTFIDANEIREEWTSELDVYENSKLILESSPQNFVVPPAAQNETDMMDQLDKAMDGRHAVSHDQYKNILNNWQEYLESWISLAIAIHDDGAAKKIQEVLDLLMAARSAARRQMKYVLSPPVGTRRRFVYVSENNYLPSKQGRGLNRKGKWILRNTLWMKSKRQMPAPCIGIFKNRLKKKARKTME